MALGWRTEQIIVIDSDLGQSGASAVDRVGFQRLVADVGMGKPGSYSDSRYRALRVIPPTGIDYSRSAR
jgi:hypothetical protein